MKHLITRTLPALLLAACLLFGMHGTAFAQEGDTDQLAQILTQVQELMDKYGPEIPNSIREGTGRYTMLPEAPAPGGYYVAIGDESSRGSKTYVGLVADEWQMTSKNLSKKELFMEDVDKKVLTPNEAEIRKADVITLGFSINRYAQAAIDEILFEKNASESYLQWSKYVPAEGVAEIKTALDNLEAYMVSIGVSGTIPYLEVPKARALRVAAESFAYGAMVYSNVLPQIVDRIHAINPQAVVYIVGMDNPLSGAVIDLGNGETMGIGDFLDQLIRTMSQCAQTAVMTRENTVFVPAPHAPNAYDGAAITEKDLVFGFMKISEEVLPSAEGHAYVKDRICSSFGMVGDPDGSKDVTYLDAMLVLRASVGLIQMDRNTARRADANGDALLDYLDAIQILRASVGLIELN